MRLNPIALTFLSTCLFTLAGCNSYDLRYQALPQPKGAHLYADYTLLQDAVVVSIDTDGNRLEDIYIKKADGTEVRPVNIAPAGYYQSAALGTGIGALGNHIGGGVGTGIPIGPRRTHGLTTATFSLAAVGPAPWNLHLKVHDIPEATFPALGGPPTTK